LDELESYIKRQFIESKIEEKDDLYITNARQKEALVQTKDSLETVQNAKAVFGLKVSFTLAFFAFAHFFLHFLLTKVRIFFSFASYFSLYTSGVVAISRIFA